MTPGLLILELMVRAGSLPTRVPFKISLEPSWCWTSLLTCKTSQQATKYSSCSRDLGVVERDSQDQRWLVLPQVPAAGKHFLLSLLRLFEDDVLETWEVAIRVAAFSCKGRWESKKQDAVKQGLRKVHLTYVLKVPTAARATSFVCLF